MVVYHHETHIKKTPHKWLHCKSNVPDVNINSIVPNLAFSTTRHKQTNYILSLCQGFNNAPFALQKKKY